MNDESKKCIKFVQLAIQKLLQTTTGKAHHELMNVAKDWLSAENESTQIIGFKVTSELCRGIPTLFSSKLSQFIPLISEQFSGISIEEFSENFVLALFETLTVFCHLIPAPFIEAFIPMEKKHGILGKLSEFPVRHRL